MVSVYFAFLISSLTAMAIAESSPTLGDNVFHVHALAPCPPDVLLPGIFTQPADFFLPPLHSLKRCSRLCLPFLHRQN